MLQVKVNMDHYWAVRVFILLQVKVNMDHYWAVRVFILLQVKVNMYYISLRGLVGNRASIFPGGKTLYICSTFHIKTHKTT